MSEHHCDAIVVHCMDFRLQHHLNRWIEERFGKRNYDRVSLAGGVFDLDTIRKQVAISHRLHAIRVAVLINHEDCGAYGSEGTPERHRNDLLRARQLLQSDLPGLQVETYYLHLDGQFETIEADQAL